MDGLDDLKFNCTRRHFLSAASLGIGSTALAALLDPSLLGGRAGAGRRRTGRRAAARVAAPGAARQARHLPVPERRPVAARSVRLQAAAAHDERRGAAGVGPQGPAAHRHDGVPEVVPAGRLAVRVRPARPERRLGQRAAAAHRATIVDKLCFVRSMYTEAINHDPADHVRPDRLAAGRPAVDRRVAVATASAPRTTTCPAFVVLLSRAREGDQPLYSRLWGSGFLPSQHQGVQFRGGKDPVLYLNDPDGHRSRQPPAHARHAAHARAAAARAHACDPGDRRAHRAVRDGLPHADGGARADGPRRTSPTPSSTSTARTRASPAPSPPTACWRGGWPSATCASSSSITRAGTSTATCRTTSATHDEVVDQASAALVVDLEAPRPARRHAGDLGRRVRPHQLLAGQARRRTTTAAITTRAASRSGWPAAASRRGYTLRRDRRASATTWCAIPVHVHDFQATLLHLLGIDHERLTVQAPGPALPADRRARPRGERPAGVSDVRGRSSAASTRCSSTSRSRSCCSRARSRLDAARRGTATPWLAAARLPLLVLAAGAARSPPAPATCSARRAATAARPSIAICSSA